MLSVEKGLPPAIHAVLGRLKQQYTRDEIVARCHPVFGQMRFWPRTSSLSTGATIDGSQMHRLGTPEEVERYQAWLQAPAARTRELAC